MQKTGPWGSIIAWLIALGVPMTPLAGTEIGYGLIILAGLIALWRGWVWIKDQNWQQSSAQWLIFIPAVLLIVVVALWSYSGGLPVNRTVSLSLQFSDWRSIPVEISQENVRVWRALFSPSAILSEVDKDGKSKSIEQVVPPHWFIVMLFDKPALYRQMLVKCNGSVSLECAVLESNNMFAIITVEGDATKATLNVSVKE